MVDVIEICPRGVEVVRENDAVEVVQGALAVDDCARSGVVQDRTRERVRERHAYRGCRLARRVFFLDLLDGNE